MSKPVDELTRLKKIKIERLEGELQETQRQEQRQRQELEFNPRATPPSHAIQERIKYLREGLSRPVSDKIIGQDGKERTNEQFQQSLQDQNSSVQLEDWTIPSLDGFKFRPLFYRGFGPITVDSQVYSSAFVNMSRCRIRTLGSVEFPPVVQSIGLSDNDITDLQGVTFPPCMGINLAGNLITSLRGCTFSDEMATVLNLRDNLISKFEDLNVVALPKWLARINLERNPISDGLSADELEELHRKVLYRIMKDRNRAKHPSPVAVCPPPPPSAPPLEPDDLPEGTHAFGGPFFGGSKQKTRTYGRKLKRKKRKTNKMNKRNK